MPIDYKSPCATKFENEVFHCTEKGSLHYALSIGFGTEVANLAQLEHVGGRYGAELITVQCLATVLVRTAGEIDAKAGNRSLILHCDQKLVLHRPLPPGSIMRAYTMVVAAFGMVLAAPFLAEIKLDPEGGNEPLAAYTFGLCMRVEEGFRCPTGGNPAFHPISCCRADLKAEPRREPNQALVYRLNGDLDPLHANRVFDSKAGFDLFFMQGLRSFCMVCRGILPHICDCDYTRIQQFAIRFFGPIFFAHTLMMEFWQDSSVISFRFSNKETNQVVIDYGKCVFWG